MLVVVSAGLSQHESPLFEHRRPAAIPAAAAHGRERGRAAGV